MMAKKKLSLSVISTFCVLLVAGTSAQSNNTNSNPDQVSELSMMMQRLEAIEKKNYELEKSLKEQLRWSKKKCDEQFKTLKKELDELKMENCVGEDVWLLTPPLRGRRGQNGRAGQKGQNGRQGKHGEKGSAGQNGRTGEKGGKGDHGLTGPRGEKGDRGLTGQPGQNGNSGQNGRAGERGFKGDRGTPGPKGDQGPMDPRSLKSCSDAMEFLPSPRSQKQRIYPHGNINKKEVLCDFETDGGGWTIIQKRTSGPKEEFYKEWDDYKNGFGSLEGNFWLGLDNIHTLTKNGDQELRIDLEDFNGNGAYAKYASFSISDASDFYRLSLSGYYGNSTAGDSMTGSWNINGAKFSTKDKDNDDGDGTCAPRRNGAWWYKNFNGHCSHSNLNGVYWQSGESFRAGQGLVWESWRGASTPLKKVHMLIRKRN